MVDADLLLTNISEVLTCAGGAPFAGRRQREVSSLRTAAIACEAGRIVYIGPTEKAPSLVTLKAGWTLADASGLSAVPGFVDGHTHAIYAGDRTSELRRRLAGETYAEIAAGGGGILSTVAATRAASEEDLVAQSLPRLHEMLASGTTTC